jgi:hypothetical protein
VAEFRALREVCAPLCAGSAGIPTMALRGDKWRLLPLLGSLGALQKVIPYREKETEERRGIDRGKGRRRGRLFFPYMQPSTNSHLSQVIPYADVLEGSFGPLLAQVKDPWLRAWLDALAFSLSGQPAAQTGKYIM